jgi:hypothetical protein
MSTSSESKHQVPWIWFADQTVGNARHRRPGYRGAARPTRSIGRMQIVSAFPTGECGVWSRNGFDRPGCRRSPARRDIRKGCVTS